MTSKIVKYVRPYGSEIVAETNAGTTSMAYGMAIRAALRGQRVCLFTDDEDAQQLSNEFLIDVYTDPTPEAITQATRRCKPLVILDKVRLPMHQVEMLIAEMHERGLQVVFIRAAKRYEFHDDILRSS
jgi:Trk K+ transport system NAD-binding subunit